MSGGLTTGHGIQIEPCVWQDSPHRIPGTRAIIPDIDISVDLAGAQTPEMMRSCILTALVLYGFRVTDGRAQVGSGIYGGAQE
jgi:hypothetical protein